MLSLEGNGWTTLYAKDKCEQLCLCSWKSQTIQKPKENGDKNQMRKDIR